MPAANNYSPAPDPVAPPLDAPAPASTNFAAAPDPIPPMGEIVGASNPANNAPISAAPIGSNPTGGATPEVDLTLYKDRMLQELGLENLSADKKKNFEDKLEQLVNDRIINLIILYMPPEKVQGFADVMEAGDIAGSLKYASDNIPNFYDKVIEELAQIRDELITNFNTPTA